MIGTDPAAVDPGTVFSLAGFLHVLIAVVAGIHVVLNKRNEAAALTWFGIIVLSPFLGVTLYWLFGINRIRRRAAAVLPARHRTVPSPIDAATRKAVIPAEMATAEPRWRALMRLGGAIHDARYEAGNRLEPLQNGDAAYPAMLAAIHSAEQVVLLSSYIFAYDSVGKEFVEALVGAHRRGVMVRVMIDGIGVGYGLSLVRSDRVLRKHGVVTARFLSTLSTRGTRFINLRNHRKILAVDGQVAFVGGINIRANNVLALPSRHHTQDLHFRVTGPVVDQIQSVFAEDWQFAADETLELPNYSHRAVLACSPSAATDVVSRVLLDGPDDNYQKLGLTMVAAINAARHRIRVVTPYFIPDSIILHALRLAALRGVKVEVLVPQKNNLPFVDWAMRASERRLIENGIAIYRGPPPFDHSKLFLVDQQWTLIGSSNWDARSLELNFEINLECYDPQFNQLIDTIVHSKLATAERVSRRERTPLYLQLRNNFFRLFSPYL